MIALYDVRGSSSFPKRLRMCINLHGNAGKKIFHLEFYTRKYENICKKFVFFFCVSQNYFSVTVC
jgi:hypothetical protein